MRRRPGFALSDAPLPPSLAPLQAFESLLQLYEARATYEEFCIPMCMLPATISNNVPGTDLSIGADTALNAIVEVRLSNRGAECHIVCWVIRASVAALCLLLPILTACIY